MGELAKTTTGETTTANQLKTTGKMAMTGQRGSVNYTKSLSLRLGPTDKQKINRIEYRDEWTVQQASAT